MSSKPHATRHPFVRHPPPSHVVVLLGRACRPGRFYREARSTGPLAGKIWRFGLLGYSCRPDNVMLCLSALGSVLDDLGYPVHVGEAEAAAHAAYAAMHAKAAQAKAKSRSKAVA